jgi:hypothetical protein
MNCLPAIRLDGDYVLANAMPFAMSPSRPEGLYLDPETSSY